MSGNTRVIMTGKPYFNSKWTADLSGNGRMPTSFNVNSDLTGMPYSGAVKAYKKGHIGTFGDSKIDDECQ